MPFDGENRHPQRPHASGDRAADIAVSNDSNRLARDGHHVKSFPHASHLIADHAAEVLGEIQDCAEHKLGQGWD